MEKTIYLLEDNPDIKEMIELLLRSIDFDVVASETFRSFREKMVNKLPDLIILDIMLPDGNGVEISQQLKSEKETSKIPVLLMSATKIDSATSSRSCADAFIGKPFDIDEFLKKVKFLSGR